MVYDVVFTPEDGGAPVHEVHVVPTHGQTEVGAPGPENRPFGLDPTQAANPALLDASQPTGKRNGSYRVVPVALQPDDWPDDPDAENRPSLQARGAQPDDVDVVPEQQLGVIGALVDSTRQGQEAHPARHFVSPRRSSVSPELDKPSVKLRAQVPRDLAKRFDEYFEWVKPRDPDTGAEVGVADGAFFDVPRDKAGKYTVTVRTKVQPPLSPAAALPVDTINVWIVWATGTFTHQPPMTGYTNVGDVQCLDTTYSTRRSFDSSPIPGDRHTGYTMQFTIQPAAITDLNQDVPNLKGESDKDYPPSPRGQMHLLFNTDDISLGAPNKWDVSQSVRVLILNPNGVPYGRMPSGAGDLYKNQPKANDLVIDFPQSDVEGNDDIEDSVQENNPYVAHSDPKEAELNHNVGSIVGADAPSSFVVYPPVAEQAKYEGYTFTEDNRFATFVRLQIGTKWYRVSKHLNWHHTMIMKCHDGAWQNNGSSTGPSPDSD